ncbi:MAG: 3-deoxy-D-manno-octulosonic acid transferase [Deltaproteobacteria bacterium]|nr:3-deoxy-D-manno-octulosonic acid transferase [Deltaproteobacteria bacterium]MBW2152880.1 3-deoxy-D-manno-octulosonic acid transferase [Deltaproteobacteria bacterium]
MNIAYAAYKSVTTGLFITLFPPFWVYSRISGKYLDGLGQKAGCYPETMVQSISGSPRIWLHAVSVGEVSAAIPIIRALEESIPECTFILSTGTEHGQAFARSKMGSTVHCIYAPLDFFLSTRRALQTFTPDVLVCVETEIWPNWLIEAHRLGVKTVLVNGRISKRSFRGYLKIRFLMQQALKHIHAFSMIAEADADRIHRLGAPVGRIQINGNAKYDILIGEVDERIKADMMRRYRLNGDQPVFVAGSTRGKEGTIVLDAYKKILRSVPEALLIIAPRHVKRARSIERQAKARGFSSQFRTKLDDPGALRTAPVIIVDTIGELQALYSIASVVFCGGSLVPRGGQNILEAAVWAKPVLYGPSMDDFLDAKQMIEEAGGGVQVRDGDDLAEKVIFYLNHPRQAEIMGRSAQAAVLSHKGAAQKHARVIRRVLQNGCG